jgi:hypothetical protein
MGSGVISMSQTAISSDAVIDDSTAASVSAGTRDSDRLAVQRPDWMFRILVTALFSVAVWLLAMPWVPAIARCTMNRFHLQTDSFAAWAIQQPIPPMYSFANTTEVRSRSPKSPSQRALEPAGSKEDNAVLASRFINHFPTREFTFANARVRHLLDRSSRWFVLRSAYRGQTVESLYRLDPVEEKGWTVTRVDHEQTVEESER